MRSVQKPGLTAVDLDAYGLMNGMGYPAGKRPTPVESAEILSLRLADGNAAFPLRETSLLGVDLLTVYREA